MLADVDGDYSDWIEIQNVTDNPVDLEGWHLTDDPAVLDKWTFPDVPLAGRDYLVVFASDKDRTDPAAQLHTNFQLDAAGEYLGLIAPDGATVVHEYAPTYPEQLEDISYGLRTVTTAWDTLMTSGAPARYHVPTPGDDATAWTVPGYDDSAWVDSFGVGVAGLLIAEIGTGDGETRRVAERLARPDRHRGLVGAGQRRLGRHQRGQRHGLESARFGRRRRGALQDRPERRSFLGQRDRLGSRRGRLGDDSRRCRASDGFRGLGLQQRADRVDERRLRRFHGHHGRQPMDRRRRRRRHQRAGRPAEQAFVAFNDHVAGATTHANATSYDASPVGNPSGPMRNIVTGANTSATMTVSQSGVVFDANSNPPAVGTDAYNAFYGYVDFATGPNTSLEIDPTASYTHRFSGLDTGDDLTYSVTATSIRGNSGYANRWTLVTLVGAVSSLPAHSVGSGIVVVSPTQVAYVAGANQAAGQGFVAHWTNIDPGADGEFSIVSTHYRGPTPTGTADGSKSYAVTAVKFEAVPSGPLSYLRRIGSADGNAAADFLRSDTATKGQQNLGLTVPFGQILSRHHGHRLQQ